MGIIRNRLIQRGAIRHTKKERGNQKQAGTTSNRKLLCFTAMLPAQPVYGDAVHSNTRAHTSPTLTPLVARGAHTVQPRPSLAEEEGGRFGH